MGNLSVRAFANPCTMLVDLYGQTDGGVACYVVMREKKVGETFDPFLRLSRENAQVLMDSLWTAGLRPAEGQGTAGQAEAMKAHIEDLRLVTRNLLEKTH